MDRVTGEASSTDTKVACLSLEQPRSRDVLDEYYRNLVEGSSIEIRYNAGRGKGKGMFAVRNAEVGDVLFVDKPLVAMQSFKMDENRPLICEQCFRYIDASLMIR
eukprot:jgi/Picre1/29686/NNA_005069.t1